MGFDLKAWARSRITHYKDDFGIPYVATSDGRIFFDDERGNRLAELHEIDLIRMGGHHGKT